MSSSKSLVVRQATKDDCPQIVELIKMLARYENMEDQVQITPEILIKDGFDCGNTSPAFHCLVSCDGLDSSKLTGYLIYYYTYSTWEGRCIYMEDIFVDPEYRRQGTGKALITRLALIARNENIARVDFAILNWNQVSINFHESLGAVNQSSKHGWNAYRITGDALKSLADSSSQ